MVAAASQVVFLTFGLHTQLAYVIRNGMWLGIWFALASRPLRFADLAKQWNREGNDGRLIEEDFGKAYDIVWKLLLCYVLYSVAGLIAAAAGKALSLQFHHDNHFAQIQARLERSLSAASSGKGTGATLAGLMCPVCQRFAPQQELTQIRWERAESARARARRPGALAAHQSQSEAERQDDVWQHC